ncbi:MAG: glycosyltransferase family 4 protein [Opitutales bacterium]|nr:glycosyltransferase family 4 protein [Opitutales bacterium]
MISKTLNRPKSQSIAIAWKWFPQYAAQVIGQSRILQNASNITLVGTKSARPYKNLEETAGYPIHWIRDEEIPSWQDLGKEIPHLFITCGWAVPGFQALAREVKQNGGVCITTVDNRWRGDLRQFLGAVYYRLKLKRFFDGAWVAGASAERLMKYFGVPKNRIWKGLYGADPEKFSPGPMLSERPKRFLFVGSFLPRKGLTLLAQAWREFSSDFPDWECHLYGNGDPKTDWKDLPRFYTHSFVDPCDLPKLYQSHRCFVLPSNDENWGLVVHEALCSGCGLIVSDRVGSAEDLVTRNNGIIFKSGSASDLLRAMIVFAQTYEHQQESLQRDANQLRNTFGPQRWNQSLEEILTTFHINPEKL